MLSGAIKVKRKQRARQDRAPHQVADRDRHRARACSRAASARCRSRRTPRSTCSRRPKSGTKAEGFAREDEALADLIAGDQFAASMYAFDLVQKRAKRPVGAPDKALAKKVTKVGVIGAGLHGEPVRAAVRAPAAGAGAHHRPRPGARRQGRRVHPRRDRQARGEGPSRRRRGQPPAGARHRHDRQGRLRGLRLGHRGRLRGARRQAGTSSPRSSSIIADDAILATNTSSLSVEEIGAKLAHPERLVGFHFFNPVAVMPLIEIVKTPQTTDAALSTAFVVARRTWARTRSSPPTPRASSSTACSPKVLGEAMRAVDEGTPFADGREGVRAARPADDAVRSSSTSSGWKVAAHVQDTMAHAFPDRFFASREPPRARRARPSPREGQVRARSTAGQGRPEGRSRAAARPPSARTRSCVACRTASRSEIQLMLDEGVVPEVEDIDLCLILGAGWPVHRWRRVALPRPRRRIRARLRRHVPPPDRSAASPAERSVNREAPGAPREGGRSVVRRGSATRRGPSSMLRGADARTADSARCSTRSRPRATGMRVPSTCETTSWAILAGVSPASSRISLAGRVVDELVGQSELVDGGVDARLAQVLADRACRCRRRGCRPRS